MRARLLSPAARLPLSFSHIITILTTTWSKACRLRTISSMPSVQHLDIRSRQPWGWDRRWRGLSRFRFVVVAAWRQLERHLKLPAFQKDPSATPHANERQRSNVCQCLLRTSLSLQISNLASGKTSIPLLICTKRLRRLHFLIPVCFSEPL